MLRDEQFLNEYRSGSNDVVSCLYSRALRSATEYNRAVGFFSSSALEVLGAPLANFAARDGLMRLVTSVRLSKEDIAAIHAGLNARDAVARLLEQTIVSDFHSPLGTGTFLLTSMLAAGRLEIKIAIPLDGLGIYHEKVGVFLEGDGDFVAFSGSSNESRSAFEANYECVDVYRSWDEPKRASAKLQHFRDLWKGVAAGVVTLEFPDAARRALLERHAEEVQRRTRDQAFVGLWPHQREAVREFLKARRGVLEMATGTGKTRTALAIASHLLATGQIDTVIVATDGNDLLSQWHGQLLNVARAAGGNFPILRQYFVHHERDHFLLRPRRAALLTSRENLASAIKRMSTLQRSRTLLIHDEVHRLGSLGNRSALLGLSSDFVYRLGLSATPEREYDADGNGFIEEHIGPIIMRFELADAIRRGILTPFDYHPITYTPSDEDKVRLQDVYRRQAASKLGGRPMSKEEVWIELARVHKTSKAKLPPFTAFLAANSALLRRAIIFVETREYGEEVLAIVHRHRHDFHTYYAEDDVENLERFAAGDINCLITCHRLSEGIDIRSIETVILLSAARARLETIQRIGRCLRVDPENPGKRAHVVDLLRNREADGGGEERADDARRAWLSELAQTTPNGVLLAP